MVSRYVIVNAKQYLVKNRLELQRQGEVKFNNSTVRMPSGNVITASTGRNPTRCSETVEQTVEWTSC